MEAIDQERAVKVVPFLYLSKDQKLKSVPFGISLDKSEDEDSVQIHGINILQKTLHSESSYQVFEVGHDGETTKEGDFGVFALNIEETEEGPKIWQPELILDKYAPQMLHETVANEMDPNLVLIRLGPTIDKTKLLDKSIIIGTVAHGDTFSVSFARANFEKKRDAMALTRLNRETKETYFRQLDSDLERA